MERFFDKLFVKVKEQEDCNKKIVIFFKFWGFSCFFFKVKKQFKYGGTCYKGVKLTLVRKSSKRLLSVSQFKEQFS